VNRNSLIALKENVKEKDFSFRRKCTSEPHGRIYLEVKESKLTSMNPKGGELLLSKAKSEETQMEAC